MTSQMQNQSTTIIAQANRLLTNQSWKLTEGLYAESTAVSLFIDPLPGAVDGRFHAPITLFPLLGQVTDLQGATVSLMADSSAAAVYYGQLDKRGQLLFRDLQPDTYHCLAIHEPDTAAAAQPTLSVLPPLAAPPSAEAADNLLYRFVNASQSLQIILRRAGENYQLSFQAQDAKWQNKLIAFAWTPLFSTEQNPLLAKTQLLLAVLTKDEAQGVFQADVNVGQASPAFALRVSDQPWAWQGLVAKDEDLLRQSIARAADAPSRRAWQDIATDVQLPAEIQQIIGNALSDLSRSPLRLWWRQAEAVGEQISRFINTLQVQIRAEWATFSGLPSAFHAPGLATAVLRSQDTTQPNPVNIVPLTAPSETFSLRLIVGPVSGQQTTFSIQVMDMLLPQPLPRVRINLLNEQKQLLEGDMTREDGLVTFHALEPGTYFVHVWYRDEKLELPITFTADG